MYNYKDNIYNDFVDPSIKRYVYIESVIDDVMGSSHCIYDIDNDDNNNDDVDDDIGDDDIDVLIMSNSKELKHIQDGKQTDTLGNRQRAVIIVHYDHNDRNDNDIFFSLSTGDDDDDDDDEYGNDDEDEDDDDDDDDDDDNIS